MAIDSLTHGVKSADREIVRLFAQFTGNGSSAPSNVRGRGVSVSRTGTGTYEVTFPATLALTNVRAWSVQLLQAVGTHYVTTQTISSGKMVVTAKNPVAGSPYAAVDLSSSQTVLISVDVRDTDIGT